MNKTELVKQIARESKYTDTPVTRTQVRWVVDALFEAIRMELADEDSRVEIEHFGVWERHTVHRLNTGTLVNKDGARRIPAKSHSRITFRTAKRLRSTSDKSSNLHSP
ncbi:MAG: HU family DNA-binding protein [Anaerolineaceae bacterium]|nr:HU family DNA-binding protein [Anaerolineaceae bacterium]